MFPDALNLSRRRFLAAGAACGYGLAAGGIASFATDGESATAAKRIAADENKALVAITLDLEMSRNFPTWDQTHWDYEKGNLDADTKRYSVEAARRVKEQGGVIHFFAVGRVLEQEDVSWLKQIDAAGHPVGNHTYDHVYVLATKPEDIQFRFKRAPWLIEGRTPQDVIAENIRLTTIALKERAGITASGFRTPGGFANGLADRPDVQNLILEAGFSWASCKYPAHPNSTSKEGEPPSDEILDGIVKAQTAAQPFVYPTGLIEIPMSPISDIGAFRHGRWKLESFLKAIRLGLEWAIENHAVYDFLSHPSCLLATDPHFEAISLICEIVKKAGDRAALVDLNTIAERVRLRQPAK